LILDLDKNVFDFLDLRGNTFDKMVEGFANTDLEQLFDSNRQLVSHLNSELD
jgi:hypothetical protein